MKRCQSIPFHLYLVEHYHCILIKRDSIFTPRNTMQNISENADLEKKNYQVQLNNQQQLAVLSVENNVMTHPKTVRDYILESFVKDV